MGYVGNQQAEGFVQRPTKQDLTGATGDTLTLTHAVSKEEDIDLYINNVKQEPTTAYTVNDTAVTLTGDVVASDDIYVVYNSLALQTVVPPDGSISTDKLANNAVTMSKLASSGTLPALNGSALTNIGGALTAVSEQTASGSSTVDFTGIPSGVELVKFTSWGLSSNATATIDIRIGDSGGFETTGYARNSHYGTNALVTGGSSLSGDSWRNYAWVNAASVFYFSGQLVHAGSNRWIMDASIFVSDYDGYFVTMMGYKELSGELDRIQFFPTAGTFDAGTIRIMYA
jgi:hypothetical protein